MGFKFTFTSAAALLLILRAVAVLAQPNTAFAAYHFGDFNARPPIHEAASTAAALKKAITPDVIKSAYGLPKDGGHGTIAIIGAYDTPNIEADLAVFSTKFNLSPCTSKNGCFEKHAIGESPPPDAGWKMGTALDVEWAHAIAPHAKILLIEAKTPSGKNLVDAVDYARSRADVVAVSMSWGGPEFTEESTLDTHFMSTHGATFFAASGDNGAGTSWPAASPYVVAVGGSKLTKNAKGVYTETAWSGSGGGVSAFESEPSFQQGYKIAKASGMRAIPDVAYNADPASGFLVYSSQGPRGAGWHIVGGTSAGAPQWAAIRALSTAGWDGTKLYTDKSSSDPAAYFRDITSGKNGDCGFFCTARSHYDYVTGLGTPRTSNF